MDESVVKHLERPQVGTLKLSEAIRIGARMRPQATTCFFRDGRSCALGAAYEATYGEPPNAGFASFGTIDERFDRSLFDGLMQRYPILSSQVSASHDVSDLIYMRNDRGQTREQIADWLEAQGF